MKYGAILVDPPWQFKTWTSHKWRSAAEAGRNPESHYPTMTMDTLKSLPIQPIMAQDCAVFMWVTWPTLESALELGKAWGLKYKTAAFCWAKTNKSVQGRFSVADEDCNWHMGMGYYSRANTEPCLLFVKGSPKRKSKNVRQLIVSAVQRHSQKPDKIYGRIEALVDGPYLEVFARQRHEGWDAMGNEISGLDIREELLLRATCGITDGVV